VVLFIARTAARRDTIAEAVAGWAGGELNPRFQVRSLTVEQACAEFRALILGEKQTVPAQATTTAPAAPPSRASQDGVLLSWKELELLRRFQDEALHAIQRVRHTPCGATGRVRTQVSGANVGRRAPSGVASRAQAGHSAVTRTGTSSASM